MSADLLSREFLFLTPKKGQDSSDFSMLNTASTLGSPCIAVDELDLRK